MRQSDPNNSINPQWNMAHLYYIELVNIMRYKDDCRLRGDLNGWLNGLEIIYSRISFKLKTEEVNYFTEIFNKVEELKKNFGTDAQADNLIYSMISKRLKEADTKIIGLMDKYKMIFPDTQVRTLSDYEAMMGIAENKE